MYIGQVTIKIIDSIEPNSRKGAAFYNAVAHTRNLLVSNSQPKIKMPERDSLEIRVAPPNGNGVIEVSFMVNNHKVDNRSLGHFADWYRRTINYIYDSYFNQTRS